MEYIKENTLGALTQEIAAVKTSARTIESKAISSATYSVTIEDFQDYKQLEVDTTSNPVALTLPDMASVYGYQLKIKHSIQGSTNILTINRAGTDTITQDALTSIELPEQGNYIDIFASSVTSGWEIIDESITSQLILSDYAGFGSADTRIMRFTNVVENIGNMFTENHVSGYNGNTEGLEITPSRRGKYSFEWYMLSGATSFFGWTQDSSQLSTNFESTTLTDRKTVAWGSSTYFSQGKANFIESISSGVVLRPHTNAVAPYVGGAQRVIIRVTYLGQ